MLICQNAIIQNDIPKHRLYLLLRGNSELVKLNERPFVLNIENIHFVITNEVVLLVKIVLFGDLMEEIAVGNIETLGNNNFIVVVAFYFVIIKFGGFIDLAEGNVDFAKNNILKIFDILV